MRKSSHCLRNSKGRIAVLALFLVFGMISPCTARFAIAEDEDGGGREPQAEEAADPGGDSLADLEKVISEDNGAGVTAPQRTASKKEIRTKPRAQETTKRAPPPEEEDLTSDSAPDPSLDALEEETKSELPTPAPTKRAAKAKTEAAPLPDDTDAMPSDAIDSPEASLGDEPIIPDDALPPPPTEATRPKEVATRATPKAAKAVNELPPVSEPPPAMDGFIPSPKTEAKNAISNLEFKMNGGASRIVVSFQGGKPNYREERNPNLKQVVYYFPNSDTPQRLQRAYDTTEFPSPVSLFTLLQLPGAHESKLIVQLREDKTPEVQRTLNGLYIDFAAPDHKLGEPKVVIGEDEGLATEENIYASGKTYSGKRIERLEIKNSDVQDVLRLIAKSSGYNIVVGDDVTGKVGTLSLESLPWDQAFTLVLQSKKLGYVRQGNVLRVGTLASLKSEKEEALANENSRLKVEPLRTVLLPISYAKAADIAPRAKSFLTERGTVETDSRSNTVIVKDVDQVVQRVQKLVLALDTQPPRVAISAKIVEMGSDFKRSIGFSNLSFSQDFAGINTAFTSPLSAGGTTITTIKAPNFANLLTQFNLAETDSKVKVLANPSLSVVANQQATVNQAFSFFIPISTATPSGPVQSFQQVTANLNLDVTPIVAGDGSIIMTVAVKYDIPNNSGALSTIDSRSVNTQVLVENGDTAVIGGIFSNTVTNNRYGVPFLSHIPVLGFFFSSNDVEDKRNEIYIFLTGKVLNPEEAFKRAF